MWYIYNRILHSHEKEWDNVIWNNMDGPRGYHTKWSKPKTNILWYHLYVESKKKKKRYREFPGGLVVRTQHFHCHGLGSIPGWGPEIFQALWHGKKKDTTDLIYKTETDSKT